MKLGKHDVHAADLRTYATLLWVGKAAVIGYVSVSITNKGGPAGVRLHHCSRAFLPNAASCCSSAQRWASHRAASGPGLDPFSLLPCISDPQATPIRFQADASHILSWQVVAVVCAGVLWLAYVRILAPLRERLELGVEVISSILDCVTFIGALVLLLLPTSSVRFK